MANKNAEKESAPLPVGDVAERRCNRWLLVFYDLIIFAIGFWGAIMFKRAAWVVTPIVLIYQFALAGALVFGMRFCFKVYKVVWRLKAFGAFSRQVIADMIGGVAYVALGRIGEHVLFGEPRVSIWRMICFVVVDLIGVICSRIIYYYMYQYAHNDSALGRFLRRFLSIFGMVDFNSREVGGVLRLALVPDEVSSAPINDIQRIIRQFAIRGEARRITQIKKGYINQTYQIETITENGEIHRYMLQRINTNVFPDMDALMKNYVFITDHLHGKFVLKGKNERGAVAMIRPTKDGRSWLKDDSGSWRMTVCFDNVYSLDIPDSPETFYLAGQAFGSFIREMSDVEPSKIAEVIPNFHNTWSRYQDLERAIEMDPVNRVKDVGPEIEFVRNHKSIFNIISQKLQSGEIPTRVCHNDCNLNNILFDNDTHYPVAIIDLDTVMPSSPLYDYGDSMRIGTNTAVDDEKDLSKVSCDLHLYERYARGWLEACGDMLTKEELELLPYAALVITSEDGIRFLMDYINGDTYYNIYYPDQNLDRCRTQLKLLEDMERKLPQIRNILNTIYRDLGLDQKLKTSA